MKIFGNCWTFLGKILGSLEEIFGNLWKTSGDFIEGDFWNILDNLMEYLVLVLCIILFIYDNNKLINKVELKVKFLSGNTASTPARSYYHHHLWMGMLHEIY